MTLPYIYEYVLTVVLRHLGNSAWLFCNHRESVERVGKYLQSQKFPCGVFHGGMEQEDRERSLYKFRNGSCHVLISTDLAARGLDIPDIDNIVHYHLPIQEDGYIHRNGRTMLESTLPPLAVTAPTNVQIPQIAANAYIQYISKSVYWGDL